MIINLTMHMATSEQVSAGVVNLPNAERSALTEALNFTSLPTVEDISERAEFIAELALYNGIGGEDDDPVPTAAMIGGAGYLMRMLEEALMERGIKPLYAFSVRESVEEEQEDGSVRKVNIFKHVGFVNTTMPD